MQTRWTLHPDKAWMGTKEEAEALLSGGALSVKNVHPEDDRSGEGDSPRARLHAEIARLDEKQLPYALLYDYRGHVAGYILNFDF